MDRGSHVWHYPHYRNQGDWPSEGVRYGKFQLTHFFEDEHCELYDLTADIGEQHDLAATQHV